MTELNPEQARAAAHRDGPMLVLAGPGAGKTRTLVARYAALVRAGVPKKNILAVTFTRAAAQQLRARIASEIGGAETEIAAGTFHAVCLGLLRRFPERFPELSGRRIVEEAEQKQILQSFDLSWVEGDGDAIALIERLKDNLVTPEEQERRARALPKPRVDRELRLAALYRAYQDRLVASGLIDFGDIILGAVRGLEADPAFARALSAKFRYIMVDEYQDINAAQDRLLDALLAAHRNLWVVGDDDQSIYAFRGSSVSFILDFERKYGAEVVRLGANYRSTHTIVRAAESLIGHNRHRLGKTLRSTGGGGDPVSVHGFSSPSAEAEWIAKQVRAAIHHGVPAREIAVLTRVGYHLTPIERALEREIIPVDVTGTARFWTLPEVRLAIRTIAKISGEDLYGESDRVPAPAWLERTVRDNLRGRQFHNVALLTVGTLMRRPPGKLSRDRKAEYLSALAQLKEEIQAFPTAAAMRERIRRSAGAPGVADAVQACSIHAAKGLEWRVVFLAACENGVMPHKLVEDEEEERRLAFVALTRARERLVITYAAERNGARTGASKFIREIAAGLGPSEIVMGGAAGARHRV